MGVSGRALRMWGLAVLLAVCLAYGNSFENPFEFDDFHTVTDNPAVRTLANAPRFFTDATTFSVLPANRTYRPLVSLSLAVDYAMGRGYVPLWFHVSTFVWLLVLLYVAWGLYRRLMDASEASDANVWLALFTAAWFGLHPAIAETVNYVIQRGDLYCTLGCVTALAVYVERPAWRRWGLYLLPLMAALLSKPPAAVFPVLLMMYVFYFETDGLGLGARWVKSFVVALPSVAVMAALMVLQSAMTPKSFAPSMLSATEYRMVQPLVWLRYSGELFLPVHLNIDSDLQPMRSLTAAGGLGFVFVALLALVIGWASRSKRRAPIAFGLVWFVSTQLPTSLYALSEVENDHRMFFSFVGLMLAVVWAGRLGYERVARHGVRVWMRPLVAGCGVLVLCGYAWGTHVRNRVWRTQESVWRDDVLKSPHNGRGLMIYGLALMQRGAFPEALEYYTRALEYTPNYPTLEINLGVVNGAMGRPEEAERHFQRALTLAPMEDSSYSFYGAWLMQQGRRDKAIGLFRAAIATNPARPMQRGLLLNALRQGTDVAAVEQAAREMLQVVPGDPAAMALVDDPTLISPVAANNLAAFTASRAAGAVVTKTARTATQYVGESLALNQQGKYEESIAAARKALAVDLTSAEAWNNIAANYEAMKQWEPAIAAAQKAVALKPDFQLAKNNLAWSMTQKNLQH